MEASKHELRPGLTRGEPRRAEPSATLARGGARGAKPPLECTSSVEHPKRGTCSRRYSPQEKRALLLAYESARAAGETMDAFAARHGRVVQTLSRRRFDGSDGVLEVKTRIEGAA